MKKRSVLFLVPVLGTIVLVSAFMNKSSNGIAGYTGSPGEGTCSSCHSGGSSASSGITITAVPEFSLNQYMPDSTYQITVTGQASGFNHYGFGCEILDSNLTNAGTMLNAAPGVKFINGTRRNATHTIPRQGAQGAFTFDWVAPAGGKVRIFAIVNAVNNNNNSGGDFPLAPVSLTLSAAAAPQPTLDTRVQERTAMLNALSVYPNPAKDFTNVSYELKKSGLVKIELTDLNGRKSRTLTEEYREPGKHNEITDLQGIAPGVYFIRASLDNQKLSQKLITLR